MKNPIVFLEESKLNIKELGFTTEQINSISVWMQEFATSECIKEKEEIREWLVNEDFEGLAERI